MPHGPHVRICLAAVRGTGVRLSAEDVRVLADEVVTRALREADPKGYTDGCSPKDVFVAVQNKPETIWKKLSLYQREVLLVALERGDIFVKNAASRSATILQQDFGLLAYVGPGAYSGARFTITAHGKRVAEYGISDLEGS